MTAKVALGWDVWQAVNGETVDLTTRLVHFWGLGHAEPPDRGAASYESRSPASTDEVSGIPLQDYVGYGGGTMLQAAYNAPTMGSWGTSGFSAAYWFRPIANGCPPDFGRYVYWTAPQYLSFIFYGGVSYDQGKLQLRDIDGNYVTSPGNLVGLSAAWHHMLITYDPADRKGRVYCDGSLFSTTPALANDYKDSIAPIAFGWDGYTGYYGYEVDDVAIWTRVLGADHAAALYAGATWPDF